MLARILNGLKEIEEQAEVRIIYACESGSRAWGFPSRDSDYDVRFIYLHPLDWYLSITEKKDVIEQPINDLLDINGWDLRKALKLFRKSNPPLLEWLQSPIVYLEKYSIPQKIRNLSPLTFSPKSCMYHYLSMAKGNFREYLQGELVKTKKYFYVLRPILACLWIESKNTMPPMEFEVLVSSLLPDGALKNEIQELLRRKKAGDELSLEPKIEVINEFLDKEISHLETSIIETDKSEPQEEKVFNQIFREALKEVWNQ
jgi:uncharacterized protein